MNGQVVVIGGGAAGMMAAGRAGELGVEVLLLEKTARPGSKILLTGGGRCNLTSTQLPEQVLRGYGHSGRFVRHALGRFTPQGTVAFFHTQGVPTYADADGRVYPHSQDSADVVSALTRYCRQQGVKLHTMADVEALSCHRGAIAGVRLHSGEIIAAVQVVLATGGCSYPRTGSTGDGFRLAAELDHRVQPAQPGLVPLVIDEPALGRLQGLSLPDVSATLHTHGTAVAVARGGLVFTHYGVSGPCILNLTVRAAHALSDGGSPPLARASLWLDLVPDLTEEALDAVLTQRAAGAGRQLVRRALQAYVPQALAEWTLTHTQVPLDLSMSQVSAEQRRALCGALKRLALSVRGTRPMREAMVTVGGVALAEIDPRTMASRRVRGLFFAGEVIDVAGETGGYNLQFAFSSGRLAGESAARALSIGERGARS